MQEGKAGYCRHHIGKGKRRWYSRARYRYFSASSTIPTRCSHVIIVCIIHMHVSMHSHVCAWHTQQDCLDCSICGWYKQNYESRCVSTYTADAEIVCIFHKKGRRKCSNSLVGTRWVVLYVVREGAWCFKTKTKRRGRGGGLQGKSCCNKLHTLLPSMCHGDCSCRVTAFGRKRKRGLPSRWERKKKNGESKV